MRPLSYCETKEKHMQNVKKRKIGKKTTFQVTENQKQFTVSQAAALEIPEAALVRGLIRYHKERER